MSTRNGLEDRLSSQTVPAYSTRVAPPRQSNPNRSQGGGGGGGLTRRVGGNQLPLKRPGQQPQTMPSMNGMSGIAVHGISGVRAIRGNK
jgi:hypothetical protein